MGENTARQSTQSIKIGVISDTHNFFDPKISGFFQGVEHILHAGDIGLPSILLELQEIAPVTAVSGNTDDPGFNYPHTEVVRLGSRRFLIHHIVQPHHLSDSLKARVPREKADVVIFGHTHKPFNEVINGILFFNPGYASKSRFGMERTLAILHCDQEGIRAEFLLL